MTDATTELTADAACALATRLFNRLARAHAAGQDEERDRWAEEARRTLAAVDDDEDREVVGSQLATVPGPGDR